MTSDKTDKPAGMPLGHKFQGMHDYCVVSVWVETEEMPRRHSKGRFEKCAQSEAAHVAPEASEAPRERPLGVDHPSGHRFDSGPPGYKKLGCYRCGAGRKAHPEPSEALIEHEYVGEADAGDLCGRRDPKTKVFCNKRWEMHAEYTRAFPSEASAVDHEPDCVSAIGHRCNCWAEHRTSPGAVAQDSKCWCPTEEAHIAMMAERAPEAAQPKEPFKVDDYDLYTREPEALNVGQLNRAVRMLREKLYEAKLAAQPKEPSAVIWPGDYGMDWQQVAMNGGPPCFFREKDTRLCGRALRWEGHGPGEWPMHEYVSLEAFVRIIRNQVRPASPEVAPGESADTGAAVSADMLLDKLKRDWDAEDVAVVVAYGDTRAQEERREWQRAFCEAHFPPNVPSGCLRCAGERDAVREEREKIAKAMRVDGDTAWRVFLDTGRPDKEERSSALSSWADKIERGEL